MATPLIDKLALLEKFPGKGGWTFVRIPEHIPQSKGRPFGWVMVSGTIDTVEIQHYNLQPMGDGNLFLPVKAAIRKQIGKQAGDTVHIRLYAATQPLQIPEDIKICLVENPPAYTHFLTYTESAQKAFIQWIEDAKHEQTRIDRIAKTIDKVLMKKRLSDD